MLLKPIALSFIGLLSVSTASLLISPGRQGASIEVDTQNVRTYYQDADTSIKEIAPLFPPVVGSGPNTMIPAGVARNNTPLAAIVLGNFEEVRPSFTFFSST